MAQLGQCSNDQLVGVNDAVCFTIDLGDTAGVAEPIWDDATDFVINGTIMVENNGIVGIAPTAALDINGTPVGGFVVAPGEARAITQDNIGSIGLIGAGGTGTASVKVSFSINYKY